MEQERHKDHPRKDFFEDFMILRNSDYWPCLTPKTQEGILSLLAEHRDVSGETNNASGSSVYPLVTFQDSAKSFFSPAFLSTNPSP